jgi:hypothetical protein
MKRYSGQQEIAPENYKIKIENGNFVKWKHL